MTQKNNHKQRTKAKIRRHGMPLITCPQYGAGTHVVSAGQVYKGHIPGHIKELLVCDGYPDCDSYVAINRKYRRYGIPGSREVRRLRYVAHRRQDQIIKNGIASKDELYADMCRRYKLRRSQAHLRLFDAAMCNKVIQNYKLLLSKGRVSHDKKL